MPATCPDTRWNDRQAQRTQRLKSSIIRELLKWTQLPDVLSFAGGLPAPEVFPVAEATAASARVLEGSGSKALQYSTTEGYDPLRELLVGHMAGYGIRVRRENVLITAGSQQALDLIGKLFLNSGDRVLVEDPTYMGAVQAFTSYQADYITVPIDDAGMRVDLLEDAIRGGPKFLYVLPNFQNPAGTTLSLERRVRLVELANHYGVPIVEDDPYRQLRYRGEHLPSLVKLDAEMHDCDHGQHDFTGNVIYTGTFSKILAPGFRIGWIVAPERVVARLVQMKQGTDLHTSTFTQMVAYEVAKDGFLDRHIERIRATYGERREVMLVAMERHFPEEARWTRPEGGLFLWTTLPEGIDTYAILREALDAKVAYVPGSPFFANGGGENTLRLNFSFLAPDPAEEGIRRLGAFFKRKVAEAGKVAAMCVDDYASMHADDDRHR